MKRWPLLILVFALDGKEKIAKPTPLDEYVAAARVAGAARQPLSAGSLYTGAGRFADLSRDLRAFEAGDLVTVVVSDRASAISTGKTTTSRKSSARYSIPALAGATGKALNNLAQLSGQSELDGAGETSRTNVLSTTLSATVLEALPNGYLVIQGSKDVMVNSERQRVTVRGLVRWNDLSPGNVVRSDRVAQMEVRVDGKGVIGDAVKRPFFLYRILMGFLPF